MSARRSSQLDHRAGRLVRVRARARFLVPAGVAVAILAAGCAATGGTAAQPQHTAGASHAPPATASPSSASPKPRAASFPVVVPVPPAHATSPQTRALPSATTAAFRAEMTDLWASVVSGKAAYGMRAFFPLGAYRQVKAIADPASDWHTRLEADFLLDVKAAHDLLGHTARAARLVRVIVPESEASWINPGVCYNGVGYWHVAGSRIVYRLHHQLKSIGIASLISWRGRWYVVHFGAVLRSSAVGVVDQPASGAGVTGPPGGC